MASHPLAALPFPDDPSAPATEVWPAPARARWVQALTSAALASAAIAGAGAFSAGLEIALVALASICTLDLVRREARAPGHPRPIACAIALSTVVATIFPPRYSHDLWSYAIVGRIVAFHHANPYLHAAGTFSTDPFLRFVAPAWRRGTTPYGPLFALQAAAIAGFGGSHPLLVRLAFQGAAATTVGAALWLLWREKRSTSALALLGLHPVIACSVVNGGHNDALVGLGLLAAVICTRRERYGRAGWSIAAAVLVKFTAGLALLPLIGWAFTRGRWRAAGRVAAAPLLVALPMMLFAPGMMRSLNTAKTDVITRASIWNVPLRLVPRFFPNLPHMTASLLIVAALALVGLVAVRAGWHARRIYDPADGVIAATAAWLILGAYTLPWYTVWSLPTAALLGRSRLKWVVAIQGALVTAAFLIPRPSLSAGTTAGAIVHYVVPSALLACFVWAVFPVTRRGRRVLVAIGTITAIALLCSACSSPARRSARNTAGPSSTTSNATTSVTFPAVSPTLAVTPTTISPPGHVGDAISLPATLVALVSLAHPAQGTN